MVKQQACDCGRQDQSGCNGKIVGKVSYEERDEIQALFERKNGLTELVRSLAEADDEVLRNSHFYERIVADMGKTVTGYQQWWSDKARIYGWDKIEGYQLELNFDTCQIFLRKQ